MKTIFHKGSLLLAAVFSFLLPSICLGQGYTKADSNIIKKWFPKYDFDVKSFAKHSLQFAPFACWWWPGNDVTKEELTREVKAFCRKPDHSGLKTFKTAF